MSELVFTTAQFSAADIVCVGLVEAAQQEPRPEDGVAKAARAYTQADHVATAGLAAAIRGSRLAEATGTIASNPQLELSAERSAADWLTHAQLVVADQHPSIRSMVSTVAARTFIRHAIFVPNAAQPISAAQRHLEAGYEALRESGTILANPRYTAGSLRFHQAVAEATLPGGSAWKGIGYALSGLHNMQGAHAEPAGAAERPPVTSRQLLQAGVLAASRLIWRDKQLTDWQQTTAAQLTNRRTPPIGQALI